MKSILLVERRRRGRARPLRRALSVAAAAICAAPGATACAAEAEALDTFVNELFLGEAVAAQHKLELQATAGLRFRQHDRAHVFTPHAAVELGLTDDVQIGVDAPVNILRAADGSITPGLDSVEVGLFHSIVHNSAQNVALAIGFGVELPASSVQIGDQAFGVEPVFVAYKRLGPVHVNASLRAEIGLFDINEDSGWAGAGFQGALAVYMKLGPIAPMLEVSAGYDDEGEPDIALAPGIFWHPGPAFEVGAAFLYSYSGDSQSSGATISASWEVDLLPGADDDDDDGASERATRPGGVLAR